MKTLYININGEQKSSHEGLEVFGVEEDSIVKSFYYFFGEELIDGVRGIDGIKKSALLQDFATEKSEAYQIIHHQWQELKRQLLGDNPSGNFLIHLPIDYLQWLRYNTNSAYAEIYLQKYANHREDATISINIPDLFEETIDPIRRKVVRYLKKDGHYLDFDEFTVNDEAVTRKSRLVRDIKSEFNDLSFVPFEMFEEEQEKEEGQTPEPSGSDDKKRLFFSTSNEGKYSFYAENGECIAEELNSIRCSGFFKKNNQLFCVIDNKLTEINLPSCSVSNIVNEYEVSSYLIMRQGREFFVLNNQGRIAIEAGLYDEFRYTTNINGVLARKGNFWGAVSLEGDELIPFIFHELLCFEDEYGYESSAPGYCVAKDKNGKECIIDTNGQKITDFEYDRIEVLLTYSKKNYFKVTKNGVCGVINEDNEEIIPIDYDDIEGLFDNDFEDRPKPVTFFKVKQDEELGVLSSEGEVVVPFDIYDEEYGEIDFDGENYIRAKYETEFDFEKDEFVNPPFIYELPPQNCVYDKNGIIIRRDDPSRHTVSEKQYWSLIDRKGREVYSAYCNDLFENGDPYGHHGDCYIEQHGLRRDTDVTYKIIDPKGHVLGEAPRGCYICTFVDGLAVALHNKKRDGIYVIDLHGHILKNLGQTLSVIPEFHEGKLFYLERNGEIGYYNQELVAFSLCKNQNVKSLIDFIQDGFLYVEISNGKKGLLNYNTGSIVYQSSNTDRIFAKTNDYFIVHLDNRKNILIRVDGTKVLPLEYDNIEIILNS